jgi:hypothetical protein
MMTRPLFGAAAFAAAGIAAALALSASGPAAAHPARGGEAAAEARAEAAGERLGARIQAALREGGPFFTAEERAVIERACGYPAGSWDGFEANMSDGEFVCSNGRRTRSPEVQAVMESAGPRIGRRVSDAMARADIQGEIDRIAREATAVALASIDRAEIAREAAEAAQEATREALDGAREAIEAARRNAETSRRRR